MQVIVRTTVILAVLLFSSSVSQAAVTLVRSYHLGDLDTNAANNVVVTNSSDYTGGTSLNAVGSPTYSTDVPADYPLIDTYSMNFTGANYATAAVVTNLTDNFGVSAWVKVRTTTGANRAIVYNGDTTSNGWGLYQIGNTFQGLFGGVTMIGNAPIQTDVWTHLALVRQQGVTTLYVNGIASGTDASAPNSPSGLFALGVAPSALTNEFFDGLIDEVAVFTFGAGEFSTNDLSFVSPAARTLSTVLNGGNVVLSWPTNRPGFQLQYTTNLQSGAWTSLSYVTNNNQFIATDTPGDSQRFYQLKKPAPDLNARLTVPVIRVIAHRISTGTNRVLFPHVYYDEDYSNYTSFPPLQMDSNANEYTFDLPGTVHPRTGTPEALNYHWIISYLQIPQFTDIGITGYRTSTLKSVQYAFRATSAGQTCAVIQDISDSLNPTNVLEASFLATITSSLNASMYSICQTPGVTICTNACDCTFPAAAPTNELP